MVLSASDATGIFTRVGDARAVLIPNQEVLRDRFVAEPRLRAEGVLRRVLELELDGNALVDAFSIVVTARPALAALAVDVAQLRLGPEGTSLIIDFATPRTVSMIRAGGGYRIQTIAAWNGSSFGRGTEPTSTTLSGVAIFPETRTERLSLSLAGNGDNAALLAETLLAMPDAPSDLELRLDDGPLIWRHPGPVRLEGTREITADRFNQDGERLVDIAGPLAARLGDATSRERRHVRLELTSRTAGRLDLAAPVARQRMRHVWRAQADGAESARLVFAAEGARLLGLTAPGLPVDAAIGAMRATLKATPPPERALPPLGPPASDLVDMALDADHAVILRLPGHGRLAALSALRLPLAVAGGGAEIVATIWTADPAGEPEAAQPKQSTKPVAMEDGPERWVSLGFPEPVPFPPPAGAAAPAPLWVALQITRGRVSMRLTGQTPGTDMLDGMIRTGRPAGPWHPLPALFQSALDSPYAGLRARPRMVGTPAPAAPIASVLLRAGTIGLDRMPGTVQPATPVAAGTRVEIAAAAGADPVLSVIAACALSLELSEIDIVTTN